MKTLLFPGAFQSVKNYAGYEGVDIWLRSTSLDTMPPADCYIGHSGGATFILTHTFARTALKKEARYILVNPLVRKRNVFAVILVWIQYLFGEGIAWNKIVPPANWAHGLALASKLIQVDCLPFMREIPKGHLLVIRGKNDHWFCDEKSVAILKENNIPYVEVDAGHDWNENIASTVRAMADANLCRGSESN